MSRTSNANSLPLNQCCFNVGPTSKTVKQHWFNVSYLLGCLKIPARINHSRGRLSRARPSAYSGSHKLDALMSKRGSTSTEAFIWGLLWQVLLLLLFGSKALQTWLIWQTSRRETSVRCWVNVARGWWTLIRTILFSLSCLNEKPLDLL